MVTRNLFSIYVFKLSVAGHDSEQRTQVQGYEGAREYNEKINYNISMDHVLSIIEQSASCKQFIRWECKAALIHNPNDNNKVSGIIMV